MHSAAKQLLLLTALAGLLVTMLPTASAQTSAPILKIDINPIGGPIKPDIEVRSFTIKATYTFTTPAQGAVQPLASTANVQLAFSGCPNGVTIAGSPSILVTIGTPGATTTYTGQSTFTITASRDVPGLKNLSCNVAASVGALASPAVPATSAAAQAIPFTVDYFPLIQAKVASKVQEQGPQKQIPFNIDLENKGNAQTQITFSLASAENGEWNPILPEVLILDSTGDPGGKTTDTAVFSIATPFKNGWNNDEKSFQLVMTPTAAADASKSGNVITANVLARVRGVYVPGPEPALLMGAILLVGLVVRAKKDE